MMERIRVRFQRWLPDLLAGITGAIVGAPQAMGFALIAGVNPVFGLYAATLPTIVGALVSRSALMTIAPTNALVVVVNGVLLSARVDEQITIMVTLTLLSGVFLVLLGALRAGSLGRFVSNEVMTGFITGAVVLIVLGQIGNLTGYRTSERNPLLQIADITANIGAIDPQVIAVSAVTMVVVLVMMQRRLRVISGLVGLMIGSLLPIVLGWQVPTVRDIADIPQGLPMLVLPDLTRVPDLLIPALALAILGAVQSAALMRSIASRERLAPDVNRDLLAMGVANVVGSFIRGLPVCGSLSRTAVNITGGATGRLANITSGILILGTLVVLSALIEQIALATLAANLIISAIKLIQIDAIVRVWRVNWASRLAMITTFAATLIVPLEQSIYVGVLLSLALYIVSSAERLHVVELLPLGAHQFRVAAPCRQLPSDGVVIFSVHGHLYFAAVDRLAKLLPDPVTADGTIVVLRLRENDYLGSTGIAFLERYHMALTERGGQLLLSGLSKGLHAELERSGAALLLHEENIFDADDILFNATENAYRYGLSLLERRRASEEAAADA